MMNSTEAIAARNKLGLTQEALAADLGLTESIIVAWEEGSVRIPRRFEDQLRYQAAAKERSEALASSGLPECEIDKAWMNEKPAYRAKAVNEYLERGSKHRASCSICIARRKFVEEQFGKMPPPPMSSSMRAFSTVVDRIERWPRWTQPAAWVGLWFGGYSLLKIVFRLPRFGRDPEYWLIALGGLLASISIGSVIGLIYGGFANCAKAGARAALPNGSCCRRARVNRWVSRLARSLTAETLMRPESRALAAELGR